MIFKNTVLSRGLKETTVEVFDDNTILDILKNIFDGKYNRAEIVRTLAILEVRNNEIESFFDEAGLSYWYYNDLENKTRIKSMELIVLLELNNFEDERTIVIPHNKRNGRTYAKDISKDMKSIKDEYKNLVKEYKNKK